MDSISGHPSFCGYSPNFQIENLLNRAWQPPRWHTNSLETPFPNHRTFPYILPPEIRNRIYDLVLSSESGYLTLSESQLHIQPRQYRIHSCEVDDIQEIRLSLLRTCKVIHAECKDLLWSLIILNIESLGCYEHIHGSAICMEACNPSGVLIGFARSL